MSRPARRSRWQGGCWRSRRRTRAARGWRSAPAAAASPRLLGSYDPLLHGWSGREAVLGAHDAKVVSGGLFRPFALAGGRGVATWRLRDGGVELCPFGRLGKATRTALESDAEALVRFLGRR